MISLTEDDDAVQEVLDIKTSPSAANLENRLRRTGEDFNLNSAVGSAINARYRDHGAWHRCEQITSNMSGWSSR